MPRSFACLFFLVFIGCGSGESPGPEGAGPSDTVETTAPGAGGGDLADGASPAPVDRVVEAGRALGTTEAEIRARFGEPVDLVRADTTNAHTGETDQVIRMRYPGLAFELYRVAAGDKELLMETTLEDHPAAETLPFRIGASRAEVEAYLGDPQQTSSAAGETIRLTYESTGPASDYVNLYFSGDRLQTVEWAYYVD